MKHGNCIPINPNATRYPLAFILTYGVETETRLLCAKLKPRHRFNFICQRKKAQNLHKRYIATSIHGDPTPPKKLPPLGVIERGPHHRDDGEICGRTVPNDQ